MNCVLIQTSFRQLMLKGLLHRHHPHGLPTPYLPHANKGEEPQGNVAIPLDRRRYVQRGHRNVAVPSAGHKVVWSAARPNLSLPHDVPIFLPAILVELPQNTARLHWHGRIHIPHPRNTLNILGSWPAVSPEFERYWTSYYLRRAVAT